MTQVPSTLRLYNTADGRVVLEGDPDAVSLHVGVGGMVDENVLAPFLEPEPDTKAVEKPPATKAVKEPAKKK